MGRSKSWKRTSPLASGTSNSAGFHLEPLEGAAFAGSGRLTARLPDGRRLDLDRCCSGLGPLRLRPELLGRRLVRAESLELCPFVALGAGDRPSGFDCVGLLLMNFVLILLINALIKIYLGLER